VPAIDTRGERCPSHSERARPAPSFPALLLAALAARLAGAGRAARPRGRAGRLLGAGRRRGLLRAAGVPRHQLRHPLEQHLACARRGLAVSNLRAGTAKQRRGSAASVAHNVRSRLLTSSSSAPTRREYKLTLCHKGNW